MSEVDFELCETYKYHPEPQMVCRMTIYGELEDHEVEAVDSLGEAAVGACEIRMFHSGHEGYNSSRVIFLQTFAGDLPQLRPQI